MTVAALGQRACRVEIDGETVHTATATHPSGDPFSLLRSCLDELGKAIPILCAGQILTIGSICGLATVDRPRHVRATLEGCGTVVCRFAEAQ